MNGIIKMILYLSFLLISENVSAMFVNGSFEDGLNGWSTIGYIRPTSQWSSDGNYSAAVFPKVALSKIESGLGLTAGSLDDVSSALIQKPSNPLIASIVYQAISITEGDRIDFSFDVRNSNNYSAIVFVEDGILSGYSALSDLIPVKDSTCECYCSSWGGFFNASVSGDAIIGFMVVNELNSINNVATKLDNINAGIAEVPVPAAAWLFISGILYMTLILRKRRK